MPYCPACGLPFQAGDNHCAQCGALLPNVLPESAPKPKTEQAAGPVADYLSWQPAAEPEKAPVENNKKQEPVVSHEGPTASQTQQAIQTEKTAASSYLDWQPGDVTRKERPPQPVQPHPARPVQTQPLPAPGAYPPPVAAVPPSTAVHTQPLVPPQAPPSAQAGGFPPPPQAPQQWQQPANPPHPAAPPPHKAANTKRAVILLTVIVVLVVALVVTLVLIFRNGINTPSSNLGGGVVSPTITGSENLLPEEAPVYGNFEMPGQYIASYGLQEGGGIFTTEGLHVPSTGSFPDISQTVDGKYQYYTSTQNEDDYGENLYVSIEGGESKQIAEDVGFFSLTANSDIVFFCSSSKAVNSLYQYTHSTQKAVQVAENVNRYITSPNGTHVLYTTYYTENTMFYAEVDKEPVAVETSGERTIPLSISDDGQLFIYGARNEDWKNLEVYCSLQGESKPVAAIQLEEMSWLNLKLNQSGDDVLIPTNIGLYRFSKRGFETIDETEGSEAELILGAPLQTYKSGEGIVWIYNCSAFSEFYYTAEGSSHASDSGKEKGIYFRSKEGTVGEIAAMDYVSNRDVMLSADGHTLYYTNDDDVLCSAEQQNGKFSVKKLADEVGKFQVSPDGKTMYYTKYLYSDEIDGYVLYSQNENGQEQEIAQDVAEFWIGGPTGASCSYIQGGDRLENIPGTAYLYTDDKGSVEIAKDAVTVGPPTANHGFYIICNPVLDETEDYEVYITDIYIYNGTELVEIAEKVKRMSYYDDFSNGWFYSWLR